MRRLLGVGVCALALALPASARGDGAQVYPLTGGAGVSAPGGPVNYVAVPVRHNTLLERVTRAEGAVERARLLHGRFGVPGAAYDGSTTGLSADGRTLVLADLRYANDLDRTRLAIVDARRMRVRAYVWLRGADSVDAISPGGRWLYFLHYRYGRNAVSYEVRAYDLRARRLLARPIVDPREPDEKMVGQPMTRIESADGRWVYTLYQRQQGAPFIHALDTAGVTARCIDLPARGLRGFDPQQMSLTLSGGVLRVVAPHAQALVDTRTLALVHPRRAGARRSGGAPWALLLIAAPLLLAALGVAARRRRPAQAVAASPNASKSSA